MAPDIGRAAVMPEDYLARNMAFYGNGNPVMRGGPASPSQLKMQELHGATAYSGASSGLSTVTDPEKAYANLTRQEYLDYIKNYRSFEEGLINKARTDKSLIDEARKDVGLASTLSTGVAERNAQRYGVNLTPEMRQQQELRLQRANTLGGIQAVSDARIAQREANTQLMADLINIGQGVNRSSQQQLGSAAQDASARQNAYRQAKAASKAQTYQAVGSLASTAILAFALF